MTTKIISVVVGVLAILGTVAFFGYSPFLKTVVQQFGSPVGTTFNTAKVATVEMSPATNAASSTSVLNTDASTRFVESLNAACTGVGTSYTNLTGTGLAALTITAATTTVANAGAQGNSNTFTGTVATTTAFSLLSSVIASTGAAMNYSWPSGTYLTFTFNATNTAACIVGVNYLAS
jgi:hypothetical protein